MKRKFWLAEDDKAICVEIASRLKKVTIISGILITPLYFIADMFSKMLTKI